MGGWGYCRASPFFFLHLAHPAHRGVVAINAALAALDCCSPALCFHWSSGVIKTPSLPLWHAFFFACSTDQPTRPLTSAPSLAPHGCLSTPCCVCLPSKDLDEHVVISQIR